MMERRRQALLLLLPCLAGLVVLFVLPQAITLAISFARRSASGGIVAEPTFANYVRIADPLYLGVFARSAAFAAVTTALCLLISYPVAYWLAFVAPARHRAMLVALVVLPFWTSLLVRLYAWMFLLRPEGLFNAALARIGLGPFDLLYNDAAVLLGQVYGELPFMILPLYASLGALDRSLLHAAADLGATPARTFWRVTVPLTRPGILAGCALVFVPSLGAFLAPDLLGGARTAYVGNLVQSQFASARDFPFGAALSVALTAVVLLLLPRLRPLLAPDVERV